MEQPSVVALIPAWNESETISHVVGELQAHCDLVLVVDDCSLDGTNLLAAEAGAMVCRHHKNLGYEQALNTGMAKADELGAEFVFTFDADGQHQVCDIVHFTDAMRNGADIVVGIRPKQARFAERLFSAFGKRYGIADPLCGFKGYSLQLFRDVGFFDTIGAVGSQLAFAAVKAGYSLKQIPIHLEARQGESRYGNRLQANIKLLRALWRLSVWSLFFRGISLNET